MAKYGTTSLGHYAQLLTDDAIHATLGEVRSEDENGETTWVKDSDMVPADEVRDCMTELAHHLFKVNVGAKAYERIIGITPKTLNREMLDAYMRASMEIEREDAPYWEWIYDYISLDDDEFELNQESNNKDE